jgi:hypothetical protein
MFEYSGRTRDGSAEVVSPSTATKGEAPVRFLAVGPRGPAGLGFAAATRANPEMTFIPFSELTETVLAQINPDFVISPLVGPDFDCMDLAGVLSEAGFQGRYRVAATDLPNPSLVRREIVGQFPELDFDLLELGAEPANV